MAIPGVLAGVELLLCGWGSCCCRKGGGRVLRISMLGRRTRGSCRGGRGGVAIGVCRSSGDLLET